MSMTPEQVVEMGKITQALKLCEDSGRIKEDKITEWALLKMVEKLNSIDFWMDKIAKPAPRPGRRG